MNSTKSFDVGGLLSSMSAHGVEKQLSRLPGVTEVTVNYVAGSELQGAGSAAGRQGIAMAK